MKLERINILKKMVFFVHVNKKNVIIFWIFHVKYVVIVMNIVYVMRNELV